MDGAPLFQEWTLNEDRGISGFEMLRRLLPTQHGSEQRGDENQYDQSQSEDVRIPPISAFSVVPSPAPIMLIFLKFCRYPSFGRFRCNQS